jgi:hypothetical protein
MGEKEDPLSLLLLALWIVLLVPWLLIAMASGTAFDAGNTLNAWVTFLLIVTYPVTVVVAALMRRKKAALLLLPLLNFLLPLLYIAGAMGASLLHNSRR